MPSKSPVVAGGIRSGQNGCQTNCSLLSLQSESDRGESQVAIGGCGADGNEGKSGERPAAITSFQAEPPQIDSKPLPGKL